MKELIESNNNLFKYAFSLTKDKEKADDLLQETNLRILLSKDRYKPEDISRIASITMRNIFINNYNYDKIRKYEYEYPNLVSECVYSDFLINDELEKSIELLPDFTKGVFKLLVMGYEYREIAEIENIPIGTVKTRIFKARSILKKKFAHYV